MAEKSECVPILPALEWYAPYGDYTPATQRSGTARLSAAVNRGSGASWDGAPRMRYELGSLVVEPEGAKTRENHECRGGAPDTTRTILEA